MGRTQNGNLRARDDTNARGESAYQRRQVS